MSASPESTETEKRKKEEISKIHATLIMKLHDEVPKERLNTIRLHLLDRGKLTQRAVESCESFQDIAGVLLRNKSIEHGKYDLLKEVFELANIVALNGVIKVAEEDIRKIKQGNGQGEGQGRAEGQRLGGTPTAGKVHTLDNTGIRQ